MASHTQTDLLIIGAGPAGLFAVFQAGLLGLKCSVIDILKQPGGQCTELYPEKPIYDIPGIAQCTGSSLTQGLLAQIDRFAPAFHMGLQAERLERCEDGHWRVHTTDGTVIDARVVVLAAGAGCFTPRKMSVDAASSYEGTSVLYSVRNPERFANKRVLVLGGGDSAVDWAIALERIAGRVTLVHRRDVFRAAPESVQRLHQLADSGRIGLRFGSITALAGKAPDLHAATLTGIDGAPEQIGCDAILALFGLTNKLGPITQWGIDVIEDEIAVDPVTMQTNLAGIYAIGDVARYPGKLKLILTGFSEAAVMSHAAYAYLNGEKPRFQYSTHNAALGNESRTGIASDLDVLQQVPPAGATADAEAGTELVVSVTDLAGVEHCLPAKPGRTLLEIMDSAKVPVKGSCFGACNCSTCHVYVDEAWFDKLDPMIEQEQEALDQASMPKPNSRLACQIEFRSELAGLKVKLSADTIPD
jgi:thioredoxin reductase (NADPH)